jgi:hypothetical protein
MYMDDESRGLVTERRRELLNGISNNLSYSEIAARLCVGRGELLREVNFMRRRGDPELREAIRAGQVKADLQRHSATEKREESFIDMTGMTLREKSFQNMVEFYKPEIMSILSSDDHEEAIRRLPDSTRRILVQNGILTRRKPEITKQVRELLL